MDKFYRSSINDLYNRGSLTKQKAGTAPSNSGTGLKASDWIGLGLQLYGASMADKQAEEDQARLDEQRTQDMVMRGRDTRTRAQQFEEQMQNQRRGMNMQGLEFLANQRTDAMKRGRYISLRNSFAKALSGGN